jgi:carbamoyl-phosphate synthase large subunit
VVTILLTGAGGLMGHFIMKAIRASAVPARIIGCDHSRTAAGLLQTQVGYVVPSAKDSAYIPKIIDICKREEVRLIFVHGHIERHILAQNKDAILSETGAPVVTPSEEVLRQLEDKWELTRHLKRRGFEFPQSVLPNDQPGFRQFLEVCRFPLIVKDRFGWGSRGIGVARNTRDLDYFLGTIPNPVVQEYLGREEEEYTVGVFVDATEKAAASITMRRELSFGLTMKAEVVPDPEIGEYCKKVVEGSGCFGPTNVQLRMTDRGPVVFEINARFSTTTSARCHYGYNEAEMCIRSFVFHEALSQPTIRSGSFVRVIEDVVVDQQALSMLARDGRIENREEI